MFNNRDCRYVALGGPPQNPGVKPYPNSPYWESYLNRMLFPQLLSKEEMKTFFTVDHQTFYGLVEKYSVPYLHRGGPNGGVLKPHKMTPDALMGLLLLKCHHNLPDRILGSLYGESASSANRWLNGLRDYIYQHDEWLSRGRNLSNQR